MGTGGRGRGASSRGAPAQAGSPPISECHLSTNTGWRMGARPREGSEGGPSAGRSWIRGAAPAWFLVACITAALLGCVVLGGPGCASCWSACAVCGGGMGEILLLLLLLLDCALLWRLRRGPRCQWLAQWVRALRMCKLFPLRRADTAGKGCGTPRRATTRSPVLAPVLVAHQSALQFALPLRRALGPALAAVDLTSVGVAEAWSAFLTVVIAILMPQGAAPQEWCRSALSLGWSMQQDRLAPVEGSSVGIAARGRGNVSGGELGGCLRCWLLKSPAWSRLPLRLPVVIMNVPGIKKRKNKVAKASASVVGVVGIVSNAEAELGCGEMSVSQLRGQCYANVVSLRLGWSMVVRYLQAAGPKLPSALDLTWLFSTRHLGAAVMDPTNPQTFMQVISIKVWSMLSVP
ncbi:unnamed protein product [Ostreobium quekettii]|uniref:Uncharacterized protein n=1 Tax=Ostreobium quekettii TaxID=121088 RepID=A0A8S1J742_9CHLO|nr:unnamed protein product [Ostreobium quekettii]